MKELWTLFWTFAKMGVMTFGGGMAMLPILQREVVENKHWATEEELTDYYAIGQCLSLIHIYAPDVLTEPEIRRFLGETARVGRTLVCLAEVDSTNLRARQLAAEGAADGTVVVADRQTAGRGRLGRSFQSPGGQGIYLTALLRPDLPPERLSPVRCV